MTLLARHVGIYRLGSVLSVFGVTFVILGMLVWVVTGVESAALFQGALSIC